MTFFWKILIIVASIVLTFVLIKEDVYDGINGETHQGWVRSQQDTAETASHDTLSVSRIMALSFFQQLIVIPAQNATLGSILIFVLANILIFDIIMVVVTCDFFWWEGDY